MELKRRKKKQRRTFLQIIICIYFSYNFLFSVNKCHFKIIRYFKHWPFFCSASNKRDKIILSFENPRRISCSYLEITCLVLNVIYRKHTLLSPLQRLRFSFKGGENLVNKVIAVAKELFLADFLLSRWGWALAVSIT